MLNLEKIWEATAEIACDVYGSFIDEEEQFFICPQCGEPIYLVDLPSNWTGFYCPVCEIEIMEEDEEEEEDYYYEEDDYDDEED